MYIETKQCRRCKEEKQLSEFGKYSQSKDGLRMYCKICSCIQTKEYNDKHPEKVKNRTKKYRDENKDVLKEKIRVYRAEHKEKLLEYNKNYYSEHKKECKEYYESNWDRYKKYRESHKEEIKVRTFLWREKNRETLLIKARKTYSDNINYYKNYQSRMKEIFKARRLLKKEHYHQYYLDNKERIIQYSYNYQKTPKGKVMRTRIRQRRRQLGYFPINRWFPGAHYHHLRYDGEGNQNHDVGIFIPPELHYSVGHDGKTGRGMDEINKLAILWYLENGGKITEFIRHYIKYFNLGSVVNYAEVLEI